MQEFKFDISQMILIDEFEKEVLKSKPLTQDQVRQVNEYLAKKYNVSLENK